MNADNSLESASRQKSDLKPGNGIAILCSENRFVESRYANDTAHNSISCQQSELGQRLRRILHERYEVVNSQTQNLLNMKAVRLMKRAF